MINLPKLRKPIVLLYGGLILTPTAKDVRVEMRINLTEAQTSKFYIGEHLNIHQQAELEKWIDKLIQKEHSNLPPDTYLSRCNLEKPSKGAFFGKIIIQGFIPFDRLFQSLPLYKMIEMRNKIRKHVVEISNTPFTRRRSVRRTGDKL